MRRALLDELRLALPLLLVGLLMQGCLGSGFQARQVPENGGFDQTRSYQFQALVHTDSDGVCQRRMVRVKPLSKLYTKVDPPPRIQLFDDDCERPLEFERAQYVSNETGENVSLSGPEVARFWSENGRLQNELVGWLWRSGVI